MLPPVVPVLMGLAAHQHQKNGLDNGRNGEDVIAVAATATVTTANHLTQTQKRASVCLFMKGGDTFSATRDIAAVPIYLRPLVGVSPKTYHRPLQFLRMWMQ